MVGEVKKMGMLLVFSGGVVVFVAAFFVVMGWLGAVVLDDERAKALFWAGLKVAGAGVFFMVLGAALS